MILILKKRGRISSSPLMSPSGRTTVRPDPSDGFRWILRPHGTAIAPSCPYQ